MFKDIFVGLLKERKINAFTAAKDMDIPKSVVYEWTHGTREPNAENLAKVAEYFGVSADYLLNGGESVVPDADEKELLVLLRSAAKLSGSERDAVVGEVKRGIDEYIKKLNGNGNG